MAENKPTSLTAAEEREMRLVDLEQKENFDTEFRNFEDDAWYTVMVMMDDDGTLRVRFENSTNEVDKLFEPSFFGSLEDLEDFEKRFRPLSVQVQDHECHKIVPDVKVCACRHFSPDDLLFYDVVVHSVEKRNHSRKKNAECFCNFILSWLHGPNVGELTAAKIGDVCMIQSTIELHSDVASFLEIARWRIDSQSPQEMAGYCHKGVETENNKRITEKSLGYFEQMQYCRANNRCVKQSVVRACSPQVNLEDTIEDMELDGKRNMYMILIGNVDRELCPSTAMEFVYNHTRVTSRVFIFPSLSSETFTRGAIVLHTEIDFQKLGDFLENPNHMITSSTTRPWVVIEKQIGHKNIKASIGTLLPKSEVVLQGGNNRKSNNLKIVCSGTQEFERAKAMRDFYLEFAEHQVRLHKKLASMESDIIKYK